MGVWDVVDSVVKIAMGGAVSAVTTYWILRKHAPTEPEPMVLRRLDMLESIAEQVGRVNHIFLKYSTLLNEVMAAPERLTAAKKDELDSVVGELVAAFEGMAAAEAKLLLLGEKRLEMALKLYSSKIAQFRKQFFLGRPDANEQDFAACKREVGTAREQFYELLSQRYDSDLAHLGE